MMVYRSELNNWINGNRSDLSRESLIRLIIYFETFVDGSYEDNEIIEDVEDDWE